MASGKEYLAFVLDQCPDGTICRSMMGEYVLYYQGRFFGGIYDNRLLVKPVKAAVARMPNAVYELPYEGAKTMILVDRIDDRSFLKELLEAMLPELSPPKKKK